MSIERLKEVLEYNADLGTLTWRERVSSRQLKNTNAVGYYNRDGYAVVSLNRKSVLAQKIAYVLMTGELPKAMLKLNDGDRKNIKWSNISTMDIIEGEFDHSSPEGRKVYHKAYRTQKPDKNKDMYLIATYGINLQQYEEMFKEQNGLCAICACAETAFVNGKPLALAVDHNHVTGEIRGLLCRGCNVAIGGLKEKEENLLNAIKYLQHHKQKQSKESNVITLGRIK